MTLMWSLDLAMSLVVIALRSRWIPRLILVTSLSIPLILVWLFFNDPWSQAFLTLFVLRYTRTIIHSIAYCAYRPAQVQQIPTYTCRDVSVILPTVEPNGPDFLECVQSILANQPSSLFVITVGPQFRDDCFRVLSGLRPFPDGTTVSVAALPMPSKRHQVAHAMPRITTPITVLVDDHVFWRTENFLSEILAPFEDLRVGVVASKKVVRRTTPGKWSWNSIINYLACNYLQRHNWELAASHAMDGGLFVVSGRTAAYRTRFLQNEDLLARFRNEKFLFGKLGGPGGLGPDDDNFLTREAMKQGWHIRFQGTEESTMETTLGEWPKFRGQLIRWARTTFRSNPVMLRDPKFFYAYTWSYFMVYWAGITNFALLWDILLMTTFCLSEHINPLLDIWLLLAWMFLTKVVKVLPHFAREPADILLLPCQVIFGYVHSFIKFWALITFWDCDWAGRNLDEVSSSSSGSGSDTDPIEPEWWRV